jgi:bifunctional DNA-binding transcriptional regulator/antitoxin component of YhaV-PrlF toxin-antitoxin module
MVLKPGSHGTRRMADKRRLSIKTDEPHVTFVNHPVEGAKGPVVAILGSRGMNDGDYIRHIRKLGYSPETLVNERKKVDKQGRVLIPEQILSKRLWEQHDRSVELRRIGNVDYAFMAPDSNERREDVELLEKKINSDERKEARVKETPIRSSIHIPKLSDDPRILQEQLERMRHGR